MSLKRKGTGVVIGRWQVPQLHAGHRYLINIASEHQRLIVFVGIHPSLVTMDDPLDFPTREAMIKHSYPNAIVAPLPDMPDDRLWSERLDDLIRTYVPIGDVTIYGGRDSFIPHYSGQFDVQAVQYDSRLRPVSGTEVRKGVAHTVIATEDFRRGVIYAATNKYASALATVDVAITASHNGHKGAKVLLGNRASEPELWRFPGGFVSIEDESFTHSAQRELREETGLYVDRHHFDVVSAGVRVGDWRDKSDSRIFTTFFHAHHTMGAARAGDDLDRLLWVDEGELLDMKFAGDHRRLAELLLAYLHRRID